MKNAGTEEGIIEELNFVKCLNKEKSNNGIWNILSGSLRIENLENHHAVHVTKKQISRLTGKEVWPKADLYIACGVIRPQYLVENSFVLDEGDIEEFKMRKIDFSGISVKRSDSTKYQILKMPPDTFCKLFGNYELGAGASVFCKREDELPKNESVIRGWNTSWNNLFKYFENHILEIQLINDAREPPAHRIQIARKLKEYSISEIQNKIKNSQKLLDFIFKGVGNFDEPYTATWLYERGVFRKNKPSDFHVTTGSGRSHGDFTVVIKP